MTHAKVLGSGTSHTPECGTGIDGGVRKLIPGRDGVGQEYGISKRQAYRYLGEARARDGPVPIPDRKVAFTVKLSEGLIEALRKHARVRGKRLSELVAEALGDFLRKDRRRG